MKTLAKRLRHVTWSSIFLILSISLVVASALLGIISCIWQIDCVSLRVGYRYEVVLGDWQLFVVRMDDFLKPADGKIWYGITPRNHWRRLWNRNIAATRQDPWEGEGIGYEVAQSWTLPGLRYTSGDFWPPMYWQHQRLPYRRLRVSLFLPLFLGCIYPGTNWTWRRIRRSKPD